MIKCRGICKGQNPPTKPIRRVLEFKQPTATAFLWIGWKKRGPIWEVVPGTHGAGAPQTAGDRANRVLAEIPLGILSLLPFGAMISSQQQPSKLTGDPHKSLQHLKSIPKQTCNLDKRTSPSSNLCCLRPLPQAQIPDNEFPSSLKFVRWTDSFTLTACSSFHFRYTITFLFGGGIECSGALRVSFHVGHSPTRF